MPPATRSASPAFLLATAGALACASQFSGPASGIWTAVAQLERCDGCETRVAFDLRENAQGLVTGVVGSYSRGAAEQRGGAAWVTGRRDGDSLLLNFTPACPPDDPRVAQGFRGQLDSAGVLRGVLWARDVTMERFDRPVELRRGAADTLVLVNIAELGRVPCED